MFGGWRKQNTEDRVVQWKQNEKQNPRTQTLKNSSLI